MLGKIIWGVLYGSLAVVMADSHSQFFNLYNSPTPINAVRVRVPGRDHPSSRNADLEGSGLGTTFTGTVTVVGTDDSASPIATFVDALSDHTSPEFQQAVIIALTILQQIWETIISGIPGLSGFTLFILGFSPGSVVIDYELYLISAEVEAAEEAGTTLEEDGLKELVLWAVSVNNDASDPLIETGVTISSDPTKTHVGGEDGTVLESSCPDCWLVRDGFCIPDEDKLTLACGPDNMVLTVDKCIMGTTELDSLTLDGDCTDTNIAEDSNSYIATTGLDECSSSVTFDDGSIHIANHLTGLFPSEGVISTNDRYSVGFTCSYATSYEITDETAVTSSIVGGGAAGDGSLGFSIVSYTDGSYGEEDTSETIQVGSTLYFAVEISTPITGVHFTVTDCTVKNTEFALEYGVMNDRCPNNRVHFSIYGDNDSAEMNKFSYTVFEFKVAPASTLHLTCSVVVCAEEATTTSTCSSAPDCGARRRRRRDLPENQTFFKVSKSLTVV